jgi:hypothetical protein
MPMVPAASSSRKALPTFSDPLADIRRRLWTQGNLPMSRQEFDLAKITFATLNTLIDMPCYAA